MDIFASTSASTLLGAVSSAAGTTIGSLWPVVAFAVAVPFAFYIVKQVISIIPKSKASTK